MSHPQSAPDAPPVEDVDDETPVVDETTEDTEPDPEGADDLGDPGKKALEAMKAREKAARAEARAAKKELDDLKAAAAAKDKPADEQAVDAARREAAAEATAKANARILRSEVKAAAAGKLADPTDALRLLDLDAFEVDENGDVDATELADAISDLVKNKPYLAAQGGPVQFDSGRGKRTPKSQLTRGDLKGMTPEQIVAAKAAGRLKTVLGADS